MRRYPGAAESGGGGRPDLESGGWNEQPFLRGSLPPVTRSWHLFSSCWNPEKHGVLAGESRLIHCAELSRRRGRGAVAELSSHVGQGLSGLIPVVAQGPVPADSRSGLPPPPLSAAPGYLRTRHRGEGKRVSQAEVPGHQGGSRRADSTGDCQEPQEGRRNVLSEQIPGWKSEHSGSELGQSHCPAWASASPQSLRAWTLSRAIRKCGI